MFTACRAALYDTRIPKTRAVAYQSTKMSNPTDVEMEDGFKAALRTRKQSRAADFELEDTWDEGVPLTDRDKWPICVTLNVVSPTMALCLSIHSDTLQATKRTRRRCNTRRGTGDSLEAVALLRLFER